MHAQFGEDVTDMAFDGVDDNDEFLGNLLVGSTVCQQLQDLELSCAQGFWLWFALLWKGGKHCVEVGSRSMFALLFAQPREQSCHRSSFIYEAADVAFGLG